MARYLSSAAALFALTQLQTVNAQNSYGNSTSSTLPVVDLGYQLQQATLYNETGQFYNFSNIRYAAPPTGENRFAAPQAPAVNRSVIQSGEPDRICPQAAPAWLLIADEYIPLYLGGQTVFNTSEFNTSSATSSLPVQDPRTTEDCLFLDVVVPEAIFDNAGKGYGAPVLVWIYGGGYTLGSKSDSGNPAGLLLESESNNASGVIVSLIESFSVDSVNILSVVRQHELPSWCFRMAVRPNLPREWYCQRWVA